jgi:hypothetical protein
VFFILQHALYQGNAFGAGLKCLIEEAKDQYFLHDNSLL